MRTAHADTTSGDRPHKDSQPQSRPDLLIADLRRMLAGYLTAQEVAEINKAYLFGAEAHVDQKRLSGEPYIYHPIEVARTMAELQLDPVTIAAGLLHDVIEDTGVTKAKLAREFGDEVAEVVDGVSKLEGLAFESREAEQAKNFQKMILAVAKDVRVVLVKLADRLHNMRTIEHMKKPKQKLIARETLDIYAPLAQRIGIESLYLELEDLAFKTLYPLRHAVLKREIEAGAGRKNTEFERLLRKIKRHFKNAGLDCRVEGRKKHLYSIYRKMKEKKLPLSRIADIFAFRLIVGGVDECYRALGIMHGFSKPVPGRFKDYIALPKANGYQSLHTILFGPRGTTMEIQIRTREMDRIAAAGIASHPLYKVKDDGKASGVIRTRQWLQNLVVLNQEAGDSAGFMESLKAELMPDAVYLFTPEGEIISLPKKATALDFAFAVHTGLGLSAVGVKIDHRMRSLSTRLRSGQTVEILASGSARPNPEWLSFAVTAKARSAIRQYLKNIRREEAALLGERLLAEVLEKAGTRLHEISRERLDQIVQWAGEKDPPGLFYRIGTGDQIPQLVAARLLGSERAGRPLTLTMDRATAIQGARGVVINYGKCCYPLPGDVIVATINPDRGMVVHREACPNVYALAKSESSLVHLRWSEQLPDNEEYSASIRVLTPHKRGALAVIASEIARLGSNIESVSLEDHAAPVAVINFVVSVKDKKMLDEIMRRIEGSVARTEAHRAGLKADVRH